MRVSTHSDTPKHPFIRITIIMTHNDPLSPIIAAYIPKTATKPQKLIVCLAYGVTRRACVKGRVSVSRRESERARDKRGERGGKVLSWSRTLSLSLVLSRSLFFTQTHTHTHTHTLSLSLSLYLSRVLSRSLSCVSVGEMCTHKKKCRQVRVASGIARHLLSRRMRERASDLQLYTYTKHPCSSLPSEIALAPTNRHL